MITQNEVKKHKEEILRGFQLTTTPTIKSVSALFFSGLISTYGIYSILIGMIEGNALNIALGVFILILIVADTFKRGALTKYYNSQIRNRITGTGKILKLNLGIFFLAMAFMVVFDVIGSFSTANYVEQKYKDFRATNSKEYELLEAKAKSGSEATNIYLQLKKAYDQSEAKAQSACNKSWRVPKYRTRNAQCMEKWHNSHKEPVLNEIQTDKTVSVSAYQDLKEGANDDFLSQYIFYIILFLSLSLTLLLQYTTISQIQDKKDDIEESLTSMVVGILQDRLSELETNMIQHETQRNELISKADKKEKELGRDFEERGKAISLLALGKAVDSRGQTVKRIANNESFPHGKTKAGFIDPFFSSSSQPKEEFIFNGDNYDELRVFLTELIKISPYGFYINTSGLPTDHEKVLYDECYQIEEVIQGIKNNTFKNYFIPLYHYTDHYQISMIRREDLIKLHNEAVEAEKGTTLKNNSLSKMDIVQQLFNGIEEREDNKLTSKTSIIDTKNRTEDRHYKEVMEILKNSNIIEFKRGHGYYAIKGYSEAIEAIKGAK